MMSGSGASYDQLAQQVEDLRKENSYLRRELEDNSTHLCKLENETSHMKEGLKQLQTKLEQEARSLAPTERSDTVEQLRELYMDLTHYYELKNQPHNLRTVPEAPPPHPAPRCGSALSGEGVATHPGVPPHLLEDGLPKDEPLGEAQVTPQHLEELLKERAQLLKEIEREEKERCWYYTQLQALSRRLAELPRIETFSAQMDLIAKQLEFEVQQLRSVMEERFGTNDEMVQRTQIRVARLEQLEKKLQEAHDPPSESQANSCGKTENESMSLGAGAEAAGESGGKVEMVFWLLSMLANRDRDEMSRTFLAMSSSQESCLAMRKSGCVPLLVQILHDSPGSGGTGAGGDASGAREVRSRAGAALHNVVYSQPDEGQARREMRVLHVLEQIRTHCESGWDWIETHMGATTPGGTKAIPEAPEPQICQAMCALMKLSFEEEYRRAMNELGGLQAVAELIHLDQVLYGRQGDPLSMALRRYAGMTLTNLTFGDVANKATLCSRKSALQAIVAQLESDSEELHQVVSSILRNLSWRADLNSKKALRDVGSVTALMTCALQATKESTLKSLLSALWNLSAHSTENKEALCAVEGSLGFLVSTLTYRCQTNQLAVMESGGGILRNVSSLVATREDYRRVLREHNCLQILLQHLRSHSLTMVSNACGTLWNLSARCPEDQELLWDLGAVAMLRSLIHSKHKMIAMGSAAALRNLLANRPPKYKDAAVVSPGSCTPSLYMRKQKALEAELDARRLEETFESIERRSEKVPAVLPAVLPPVLSKPLRRIESLARDYGSDSGCCFEEDEAAPSNASVSLDTASFSMLSAFLSSNAGGNPPTVPFPEQGHHQSNPLRVPPPDMEASAIAEGLARKTPRTAAKPRTAKDDVTAPTSSEDSFSLSSEDQPMNGRFRADDPRDTPQESRAKSCSPCRLWEGNSGFTQPQFAEAQALLRLKQAHINLSNDSLNSSGSTSDGYGGGRNREQLRPATRRSVSASTRKRPDRLDLKEALYGRPEKDGRRVVPPEKEVRHLVLPEKDKDCIIPQKDIQCITTTTSQLKAPEKDSQDSQEALTPLANDGQNAQLPQIPQMTKATADASNPPIKLSPSYQHVPLIQSVAKFGVAKNTIDVQAAQGMRRQAWVPTVLTGGALTSKLSPASCSAWSPALGQETLQRYSVENTPICFSRCSSLSSLSSADGGLEGQSQSQMENELDSDASLEIIEVEEGNLVKRGEEEEEDEEENTLDDLSGSQPLDEDPVIKLPPVSASQSFEILRPTQRGKIFMRQEDQSPSSPSENCVQDSPLVLSRCSSVSSLGSFDSPSFASSVQSDPGSGQISGTISPSDLPDSPGQTMPPSRCKTPCCPADPGGQETQAQLGLGMGFGMGVGSQWDNGAWRRFAEMADFRERFNLPPDLDTMIYFTVERPKENFSCASSLSALPLHEHYIQKDVELKLTPLLHQRGGSDNDNNLGGRAWDEQGGERPSVLDMEKYGEGNSDDDIEILKECISSAMPSRFKGRPSLLASLPRPVFGGQTHRSTTQLPLYMLLPTQTTQRQSPMPGRAESGGSYHDDSSYSDSPMNISSTTSLSDETLRSINKEPGVDSDVKRIEELRAFSRFHRPARATGWPPVVSDQMNKTFRRPSPSQRAAVAASKVQSGVRLQSHLLPTRQEQGRGRTMPLLGLPVIKQNVAGGREEKRGCREFVQRGFQFQSQSRRLPAAPGHELVCCSCGDLSKVLEEEEEAVANQERIPYPQMGNRNEIAQRQTNQGAHRAFLTQGKHATIAEDTPSRRLLSSSARSLSFTSLEEGQGRTWVRNRSRITPGHPHMAAQFPRGRSQCEQERDSSPSSVSMDSEDDLLQKCITSGMPTQKKRLAAARKKKTEKNQRAKNEREAAHNAFGSWDSDQDPASEGDTASESDLNSVEWRAIQEGARSVVMHLQAVSQSQEPSSETGSESGLSLMSEVSSLHSKPGTKKKGGKDNKGNGKISEGRNAGKPLDFSQRKPVPNMPVIFRGRTVIYTPKKEPISQKPPPAKVTAAKNPNLAQHRSKSLYRLVQPGDEQLDFSLPKRSSTPPARMPKSSSSGSTSSQSSTPLRRPQKKSSSPCIAEKPAQKSRGVKPAVKSNKEVISPPSIQRTATPRLPEPKKTHKSPVRIPFMRNLPKPPSRTISPLVTSEPSSNTAQQKPPPVRGRQLVSTSSRLNPPTRSGRPPTYNSDRNGFLRQLTFIKESPPRVSRRETMVPGGSRSVPTSQCASPRRPRPVAPAVFLCSSRCQELKDSMQKQRPQVQGRGLNRDQGAAPGPKPRLRGQSPSITRNNSGSNQDISAGRQARRPGSESPCRVHQRSGVTSSAIESVRQREGETFKRYSSSPAINVLNRTASRSSMRSSSSDSSGRAKSEAGGMARNVGRAGGAAKGGVTWRRIRDEDVPHILRSTLPSNALPLVPSPDGKNPPLPPPPPRRTSDATVQTDDFSGKTNSSTSPTMEGSPSAKATLTRTGGPQQASRDSPTPPSLPTEGHSGGVGHFGKSCPSKAVRVTPFNYTPTPASSGPREAPQRPPKLSETQEEELQPQ